MIDRRELLRVAGLATVAALAGGLGLAASASDALAVSPVTTIVNVGVFDGEWLLAADTVVIEGPVIAAVGCGLAPGGRIIDALGSTLIPGLIDAHTHTLVQALADALGFWGDHRT